MIIVCICQRAASIGAHVLNKVVMLSVHSRGYLGSLVPPRLVDLIRFLQLRVLLGIYST